MVHRKRFILGSIAAAAFAATLSGAAFDAAYKHVQVNGHAMTLDLIQTYRTIGKDQQALAYAAKTQPAVANHLEEAKTLPGN